MYQSIVCSRVQRGQRRAFTLVELLVVIAIIGILVALLLPAIQAAREAARRMQCSNNLKQIGLCLQNYHDIHKRFPPVAFFMKAPPSTPPNNHYHHTWLTALLPFMEQGPLYESIDFTRPALTSTYAAPTAVGQPVISTVVPTLLCPSDGYMGGNISQTHGLAITNYVGSMGWHWWDGCTNCPNATVMPGDNRNIFTPPKSAQFKDILDGTSNTVVVSERLSKGWSPTGKGPGQPGPRTDPVVCSAFVYMGPSGYGFDGVGFSKPDGSGASAAPATWMMTGPYVSGPYYLTAHSLNWEWGGPTEIHPGVIQCVLGDASVRSYSVNIDYTIWQRINAMQANVPKDTW